MTRIARMVGVSQQTLDAAVKRNEITPVSLGDGTTVYVIADVQKWAKNRPKRGRPIKQEIDT